MTLDRNRPVSGSTSLPWVSGDASISVLAGSAGRKTSPRADIGVLGPVSICVDGCALRLPSAKMRYLAAALLLHARRAVSPSRLTEALWNDDPPASARKNLHQYLHRLRALLAGFGLSDRLVRRPSGYVLQVDREELDLDRFEVLTADGRRARDRGDLPAAASALATALALWRDEALADVRGSLMLDEAAHVLAEQRICVYEERVAIDLRLGRDTELVPELAAVTAAHPLRERLREYQMLALYASGRKADALAVYQDCRCVLARELGIDPGPALGELLSAMLADDQDALASRLSSRTERPLTVGRRPRRRGARLRPPSRTVR